MTPPEESTEDIAVTQLRCNMHGLKEASSADLPGYDFLPKDLFAISTRLQNKIWAGSQQCKFALSFCPWLQSPCT